MDTIMNRKNKRWFILSIFLLGLFLRCFLLGTLPAGLHQDEAYAGYEAFCLLHYGVDSFGYPFPVYFTSWGSGMNALYSYLSIPFVYLFGLVPWATRAVQCIFGCASLWVFYKLYQKFDAQNAWFALLFMAINPWHIMMSRWGLESNLVVFFILLGVYSSVLYFEGKHNYAFLAAISFGLSLYCYAIVWLIVPVLLLVMSLYALHTKRADITWQLILGIILLGAMAMPLILFLLVNNEIIPEIVTPYFSIPKMVRIRMNEIGPHFSNFLFLLRTLFLQNDGLPYSSISAIGAHYFIFAPLMTIAVVKSVCELMQDIKERKYKPANIMTIWFVAGCILAIFIKCERINHLNWLQIPVMYMTIQGILSAAQNPKARKVIGILLLVGFISFGCSYGITTNDTTQTKFYKGYEEYVSWAEEIVPEEIPVYFTGARYSNILYQLKDSPYDFIQNRELDLNTKENLEYMIHQHITHYKNFIFQIDTRKIGEGSGVYIFPSTYREYMQSKGLQPVDSNGYYDLFIDEVDTLIYK